jgi:hypothetical protein
MNHQGTFLMTQGNERGSQAEIVLFGADGSVGK